METEGTAVPQVQKKKRGKRILIAAGIVVLAIALLLAWFLSNRKNRVVLGFVALQKDLQEWKDPVAEETGWMTILNHTLSDNASLTYHLNVSQFALDSFFEPGGNAGLVQYLDNATIGFDGTLQRDLTNRKLRLQTSAGIANMKLGEADMTVDGTQVALQVPLLMDQPISFSSENLGSQVNSSAFGKRYHTRLPENLSLPFFEKLSIRRFDSKQFLKDHATDLEQCYRNLEISKKAQEQDGLKAYTVTIRAADLNQLFRDLCDSMAGSEGEKLLQQSGFSLQRDLPLLQGKKELTASDAVFLVSLDQDGQIREIAAKEPLLLGDGGWKLTGQLELSGEERPCDELTSVLTLSGPDGEQQTLQLENHHESTDDTMTDQLSVSARLNQKGKLQGFPASSSAEVTFHAERENMLYTLVFSGEHDGVRDKLDFQGNFGNYEKDVRTSMVIDHLRISHNDVSLCKITGTLYQEPLTEQLTLQQQDTVPVFTLDEEAVDSLVTGWKQKLSAEIRKYTDAFQNLKGLGLFGG